MRRIGLLAAVLLLGFSDNASAEGPIMIVFDIDDKGWGLSEQVLSNLTDYLSVRLTAGGFQVIPRAQVKERLTASKDESFKKCYDQSCQIELGRELAAQKTLSTQVFRIADVCQVTSTMYDLKKSIAERAAFAEASCDEKSLLNAVKDIAKEMCTPGANDTRKAEPVPATNPADDRKRAAELIANEMEYFEKEAKLAEKKAIEDKKAEEEALKYATLVVKVEPAGSTVWIDGKEVGVTPTTQKVDIGEHNLKVHTKGYLGFQQQVTVTGGETKEVAAALRKPPTGTLAVRTEPPGAMVFLNSREAGKAPVSQTLPPGPFRVVAELDGYDDAEQNIQVSADQNAEITLTLRKETPASPFNTWGHVAFWSGLALAGGLGGVAILQTSTAADDYKSGTYDQAMDAADRHALWSTMAYVGFGAGGALVAAGIVLWLLNPGGTADAGQQALVHPTADGRGLTLTLNGSW